MPKYVVRYGSTRSLGVLAARGNDRYERGHEVVIRTDRGLERGEVLCLATDESIQHLSHAAHGQVLRRMTQDDHSEWSRIQSQTRQDFDACRHHIQSMNLNMELVDVERLFGGERLIVYYISEDRVDFRELVKRLASDFQTRIEMRQIGVRDEAKLLADYGDCGKPLCCNTHLSQMPPVSMKMAKLQKATLDPTKISGRCGRLKCCLRYEYDTYVEMQRELPPTGSDVITREGRGRVLSQSILAQQLLVQMEDMRRVLIPVADVLTVLPRGQGGRKETTRPEGERRERSESGRNDSGRSEGGRGGAGRGGAGRESSRRESDRSRPQDRRRRDEASAADDAAGDAAGESAGESAGAGNAPRTYQGNRQRSDVSHERRERGPREKDPRNRGSRGRGQERSPRTDVGDESSGPPDAPELPESPARGPADGAAPDETVRQDRSIGESTPRPAEPDQRRDPGLGPNPGQAAGPSENE